MIFIKKIFGKKKEYKKSKGYIILDDIRDTLEEIENLKNNFKFASGDMIDYYSYKLKAAEIRYNHLLHKIKECEVS